jgi:hypothetical protein
MTRKLRSTTGLKRWRREFIGVAGNAQLTDFRLSAFGPRRNTYISENLWRSLNLLVQ